MVDGFIEKNTFQDNPYTIPEPDTLDVLSSTRWVVEHASHAWINKEQVGHVCLQLLAKYTPTIEPVWYDRFHFHDGTERTVNWLLVLDALNFCFWAEKGQPRWRIDYQSEIQQKLDTVIVQHRKEIDTAIKVAKKRKKSGPDG